MIWHIAEPVRSIASLVQRVLGIVRWRKFDVTTAEGRSQERYRRVALTAVASAGAKIVAIVTMLITIPLTLRYLGTERYGMWMTINSIVAMMGFADLGMGLGVMNAVSEAHGMEDRQAAVRYVSSGFFMLSAVALLMLLCFAVLYPLIPWQEVFNVKSPQAIREAGPAMAVFVACFLVNLPLGIVQQVQLGYQEGFVNSLWESAGKVLGLVGLLLVIYLQAGLAWLVLAVAGAPVMAWLFNSISLYGFSRPWLRPRLWNYHGASARKVLYTGLFFFILQMGVVLIYGSDNLIITQFLGPAEVTQYAIPYQMFNLCLFVFNIMIAPLWPAYAEALARGDMNWVKKTLGRSLKLILLSTGPIAIFLIIFGNQILHLWVGPKINPPLLLSIGLGIWMVVLPFGSAMSILLNAANIFRFQIIFISLTLIFSIIFKCFFIYYYKLPGIIWGTILAYVIFFLVPYSIFIHKVLFKERNSDAVSNV
jgi:O-antigen/teichoic acid export membrane protein